MTSQASYDGSTEGRVYPPCGWFWPSCLVYDVAGANSPIRTAITSPQELERELQFPSAAGSRDLPERRVGDCGIRATEVCVIEDVEELAPQLQGGPLLYR